MANNPYVNKVQLANGTTLIDLSADTAVASDVAQGKYFHLATGERVQGTATGGGGSIIIEDTTDAAGGTIRTITATESTLLVTKNITQNGTYDPEDDDADGYSEVTVALPNGTEGTPTATKGTVSNHSVNVTPSVTNTAGVITGSTKTGTAVTVTASELASGNKEITANGTNIDVVGYSTVSVAVPSGSSKALYTYSGLASRTANSYGATNAKVTVAKAGTYNISYVAIRGSSSGTMGTNLYIGATGKGNNTTWNNGTYGQYVTYSNQSISANTDVTIYATSGNASRTVYCGQLIVQEV